MYIMVRPFNISEAYLTLDEVLASMAGRFFSQKYGEQNE
jgi:hypothetical protein